MSNILNRTTVIILSLIFFTGCATTQPKITKKPIVVQKRGEIHNNQKDFDSFLQKEFSFRKKGIAPKTVKKDIYYLMLKKQGILQ